MEAETDGMKSAALWRGSPGAKILLSHIPTNPTRRLRSLSHHSKDPHGSLQPHPPTPPPPPTPFQKKNSTASPLSPGANWASDHSISHSCFFILTYVCIHTITCMEVGHLDHYRPGKIRSSTGCGYEETLPDCSYVVVVGGWPLLSLHCKKSYSVNWAKSWGKDCTIHLYQRKKT